MSQETDQPNDANNPPDPQQPAGGAPYGKIDAQIDAEEAERRRLIAEADAPADFGDLFGDDPLRGPERERREASISEILGDHDPDAKHATYYNGLQKLLRDYLPRDPKVRRMIYDEKNILINRGAAIGPDGVRGSDGRMASVELMEDAIGIVADWLRAGGTALQLYMAFYEENERRGYPHQVDVDAQ